MARSRTGPLRRVIEVRRCCPDNKHDTRHLECGHKRIVPKATLHPLHARCDECGGENDRN